MEQEQIKSGGVLSNPYVAFMVGTIGFTVLFLALDISIMRAQGLTLMFNG
ncbi:MAG: hypothetical protein KAQ66_09430 [Rhodospirillaceae bacterium]|nr:hypothetical protein [Rhodospirillaceae bacterium]MCK5547114.1 hypothetical protein [Rhodospirillaceae bacterium]